MIRNILYYFLLCGCSVLFSQQNSPINVHCVPYIYAQLFQDGYGFSLRAQNSQHNFELAPLFTPSSHGYFGSPREAFGGSCSYYYAFFQDASFQPYLGVSYTLLKEPHDTSLVKRYPGHSYGASFDTDQYISSVMGLQYCRTKTPSLYGFVDILGPLLIFCRTEATEYYKDGTSIEKTVHAYNYWLPGLHLIPRFGIGVSF